MYGKNKTICIAGKNQCSIDFLKFTAKKFDKKHILVLPNKTDRGKNTWQPSLKAFAKKKNLKLLLLKIYIKLKI